MDSEPCKVDVLVSNPLDVEIRVTKIQFRTTGPRLICDDVCFDVAPASKRNVVLECTVEGEGEMLILGCHTEALGVTAYTPVHRNGRSYTQNEFYADPVAASGSVGADPPSSSSSSSSSSTQQEGRKVTVIGKMPLIDLRVRTSQLGAKHYLYEHEMYRHQLDITNVGTRPIRHFVPTLQYEQGDRCEILDWSEERCLPLLPEQSIPITIAVSPRLASNVSGSGSGSSSHSPQPKKPIQLMISYGEDSAGYTRSYALQFSYSVAPSISVDRVDVHGSALGEEHFTLVVGLSNRSAATLAVGVAGGPGSSGENRPWKVATPAERAAEVAPNESSAIVLDFERLVPPEEFEDVLYSYLDVPQPPSHPPPPIPNTSLSSSFHRKKGVATLTRLSNLARVASSASLAAAAAAAATAAANNNKDNVVIVSCKDICKGKDKDKDKAAVHISKLCEWVKEKAFKGLALRWRSTESAKGEVSLDDPPLTLRMIRQICIAPVVVEILCDGRRVVGDVGAAQPRTAETLHTMEVVVRNRRASRPIAGPLLVVLTVASQHGDTLPKDLFAVVGPMQAWVSELGPGMVASLKTKFIIMSPGSFTFTAVFLGEKDHQYIASTSAKIVFEGLKKQN